MTDHKALVIEDDQLAILNAAPDAMILVDPHGKIVYANTFTHQLFGFSESQLIGQPIEVLIPEKIRTKHVAHRKNYFESPRVRPMGQDIDLYALHQNGTTFPVEISLSPIRINQGLFTLAAIRDISQRKKIQDIMIKQNKQLKAINHELQSFAYIASHDLKAPLRAINSLANWIEEDSQDELNPKTLQHLKTLKQRIKRMNNLIDSLLEYSRVGRKKIKLTEVDINALIYEMLDSIIVPVSFKVESKVDIPTITTQKTPLYQIFSNLINNAIRYHDKSSGHITISSQTGEAFYTFSVADDGPGISDEYRNKIFDMFQRLDSRDDAEATGMGLAIVKKSVESVGGKVWIENNTPRGAVFKFTWPKNISKVEDHVR